MKSATPAFAVDVQGVSRRYGEGETAVWALRDVSVGFERHQLTAIMGASGSGKSTLMQCAAGLDGVTSGEIFFEGQPITSLDDDAVTRLRRDAMGFVFQAFNLLPAFTADQNIDLPLKLAGRKPDKQWKSLLVETLGLQDRLTHRPAELSGGQQQRVAIARALIHQPKVIFCDEPTGALDSSAGAQVLRFLRRSVDELATTIVMVTHDPNAAAYADRVVYLADGQIVGEDREPTADRVLATVGNIGARS